MYCICCGGIAIGGGIKGHMIGYPGAWLCGGGCGYVGCGAPAEIQLTLAMWFSI